MNHRLVFFLLLAAFSAPATKVTDFAYRIEIIVEPTFRADTLFLAYSLQNEMRRDTLLLASGFGFFEGKLPWPAAATLERRGSRRAKLDLLLGDGTCTVRIGSNMLMENPGPNQTTFQRLIQNDAVRQSYFPLYGELSQSGDTLGLKALGAIFDSLRQDDQVFARKTFEAAPQSVLSMIVFQHLTAFLTDFSEAEADFSRLPAWAQSSPEGQVARAKIESARTIQQGKPAPLFSLPDTTGKVVALSDMAGKYVLLDFWASWCGPCRREHPALKQLYQQWAASGLEIISVSLDENRTDWIQALRKDGLTWINVSDLSGFASPVATTFGVQAIPFRFFIGPDGTLVGKDWSVAEIHAFLQNELGER